MIAKKTFNSKNISQIVLKLIEEGEVDLAMKFLNLKEIKSLLANILNTVKKRLERQKDWQEVKIFSKTKLEPNLLKKLEKKFEMVHPQIIIDEKMSAGVKIKIGDKLVDATLEEMLKQALK